MSIQTDTLVQIAQLLDVDICLFLKGIDTTSLKNTIRENAAFSYFDCDKLFMYYYDGVNNRLKTSLIEKQVQSSCSEFDESPVKVYFNMKSPDKFWICEYSYLGAWRESARSAYLLSRNCDDPADVGLFVFVIPLRRTDIISGLSLGISDNPHAPVCIKTILSKTKIENSDYLKSVCKISKQDIASLNQLNKMSIRYEFIDELLLSYQA